MAFEMSPSSSAWEEAGCLYTEKHGFPIIRGTFLRVPIARTIVYWGPPHSRKLPYKFRFQGVASSGVRTRAPNFIVKVHSSSDNKEV